MKISDFRNRHRDKHCFVIGNGPSLGKTNLDLIAGEVSYAMNNIVLIFPQTKWRPTYYWNSTTSVNKYPQWLVWANEIVATGIPSFIRHNSDISDGPNTMRLHYRAVQKDAKNGWALPASIWTKDASEVIYHYRMSAYGLMQLVSYMGCNPVYMLGFDCRYLIGQPNHFHPDYESGFAWNDEYVAHETFWQGYAHKRIKYFMDYLGVDVYDCTVDGDLDVYPKKRLEDVLHNR